MPLKYQVFDAVVVAALIVGVCHLLDRAGLPANRNLLVKIITSNTDKERGGSLDVVPGAESGDEEGDGVEQQRKRDDEPPVNRRALLSKGDLAELYGDESTLSMHVRVEAVYVSDKDGSVTYGLMHGMTNKPIPDLVDEKYVHAYEVYPPGTHAICHFISPGQPCRVKKQVTMNGEPGQLNTQLYLVTYTDQQGVEILDRIPYSYVQRVVDKKMLRILSRPNASWK